MKKYIELIIHYGKRIRIIDKDNRTEVCPVCDENEDWEYAVLCEKNKDNREEWGKAEEMKMKT